MSNTGSFTPLKEKVHVMVTKYNCKQAKQLPTVGLKMQIWDDVCQKLLPPGELDSDHG